MQEVPSEDPGLEPGPGRGLGGLRRPAFGATQSRTHNSASLSTCSAIVRGIRFGQVDSRSPALFTRTSSVDSITYKCINKLFMYTYKQIYIYIYTYPYVHPQADHAEGSGHPAGRRHRVAAEG